MFHFIQETKHARMREAGV